MYYSTDAIRMWDILRALLRKSFDGRSSPFPGQTYSARYPLTLIKTFDRAPVRLRLQHHVRHSASTLPFSIDLGHSPMDFCRGALLHKSREGFTL